MNVWIALETALTALLMIVTASLVGWARGKHNVSAPATTGPVGFESAYRVQMNTLEQAAIFLPLLWLANGYAWYLAAPVLGAIWLLARAWYIVAYMRAPGSRGPAFALSFFAALGLLALVLWSIGASLIIG